MKPDLCRIDLTKLPLSAKNVTNSLLACSGRIWQVFFIRVNVSKDYVAKQLCQRFINHFFFAVCERKYLAIDSFRKETLLVSTRLKCVSCFWQQNFYIKGFSLMFNQQLVADLETSFFFETSFFS